MSTIIFVKVPHSPIELDECFRGGWLGSFQHLVCPSSGMFRVISVHTKAEKWYLGQDKIPIPNRLNIGLKLRYLLTSACCRIVIAKRFQTNHNTFGSVTVSSMCEELGDEMFSCTFLAKLLGRCAGDMETSVCIVIHVTTTIFRAISSNDFLRYFGIREIGDSHSSSVLNTFRSIVLCET